MSVRQGGGAEASAVASVRLAERRDISRLDELVHLAYRGGKAEVSWKNESHLVQGPRINGTELEALIDSRDATILVAESAVQERQSIVACILIEKHTDNEVHIGMLAVDPSSQNLGLGKLMILAAENHARDFFQCRRSTMFVFAQRDELLDWYKRLGYRTTGATKPFPSGEGRLKPLVDDAHFIVITKDLYSKAD